MYQKECEICGIFFEAERKNRKYCDTCRKKPEKARMQIEKAVMRSKYFTQDAYAPVTLTCSECGKKFTGPAKWASKAIVYCSDKCRKGERTENADRKPPKMLYRISTEPRPIGNATATCKYCGKEFRYKENKSSYIKEQRKFCSQECSVRYRKEESAKKMASGDITLTCKACGKEFTLHKDKPVYINTLPSCCSDECRRELSKKSGIRGGQMTRDAAKKQEHVKEKARKEILKRDVEENGLCAYCRTPYTDCERMQSSFRVIPKDAKFNMNGKIISCPKFKR